MIPEQVDLVAVVAGQSSQLLQARPTQGVVVSTGSGEPRDRVIVRLQLDPQVVRVAEPLLTRAR